MRDTDWRSVINRTKPSWHPHPVKVLHVALLYSFSSPPSAYLILCLEPLFICGALCKEDPCTVIEQVASSSSSTQVFVPCLVSQDSVPFLQKIIMSFLMSYLSGAVISKTRRWGCTWKQIRKRCFKNSWVKQWLNKPCPGCRDTGMVLNRERSFCKCFSLFKCPWRHFPFVWLGNLCPRMLLIKQGLSIHQRMHSQMLIGQEVTAVEQAV